MDESLLPADLSAARDGYQAALHGHNYFDYTELLLTAVELLGEDPPDGIAGALVRCPGPRPVRRRG